MVRNAYLLQREMDNLHAALKFLLVKVQQELLAIQPTRKIVNEHYQKVIGLASQLGYDDSFTPGQQPRINESQQSGVKGEYHSHKFNA